MLRLTGVLLLMIGSIGMGWSFRERWKANLDALYQMRQIFRMFQNEITYCRAPLPEACARIGNRVGEPYRSAFFSVRKEMLDNHGISFQAIWEKQMESCMKALPAAKEDKRTFLGFGNCIGYMDGTMQAEAIAQYIHKLELTIEKMEKDMWNKYRVIMGLSIMGGLMLAIMLL